jgi:glycosyltransferase involved in cell wall biosynthesis
MINKRLTIAIPTYNRLRYLKDLLEELIKQCKFYPEIEILISDNNSTDGTWEYIQDAAQTVNQIRIVRNETNIGADANFIRCVEQSIGEYIWLFGDDETLCEEAIKNVITTLNLYEMSFLLLGNMQDSDPQDQKIYSSYSAFMDSNGVQVAIEYSLITRSIFKRDLFDCSIAQKYAATRYGHCYATKKEGWILVLNKPVIRVREQRAPLHDLTNAEHLWINHLKYLKYLGVPWYQRLQFLFEYTFIGMIKRNAGELRDAMKSTNENNLGGLIMKHGGFK